MHKWTYLAAMLASAAMLLVACTEVDTGRPGSVDPDSGSIDTGWPLPDIHQPGDTGPEPDNYVPQSCYSDEPGEFGYPCTELDECNSGYCVPTTDGKRCTKTCESECPCDWNCRPMGAVGDPVFVCVPRWLHLCDPCNDTADCRIDEGDDGHYCLDHGAEGKFCGGECESDGKCPHGYECQSVPIPGGQVKPQCVPAGGATCECSPQAIEWQLSTSCAVTNDFGTCTGTRVCTATGISPCDATAPAEEACDAVDNDCNGITDDLPSDYECPITNEFGTCMGKGKCVLGIEECNGESASFEVCDGEDNDCDGITDNDEPDNDDDGLANCVDPDDDNDGVPDEQDNCQFVENPGQENSDPDEQGDACDTDKDNDGCLDEEDCDPMNPQYCKFLTELCDGLDNDCNGETDDNLCDDGEDCTIDSCNADGSCAHNPDNTALCDDGNVCTQVDKCVDGVCTGLNPQICNDFNDCTEDSCDAVAGCLYNPISGGPGSCEDGSLCTDESYCENGVCKSGPLIDCTNGNPCIFSQCSPDTGCAPPQSSNNGADCTTAGADVCSTGKCTGGVCKLTPIDGAACTVPGGGQCSSGTCTGGQCLSNAGMCSKEACPPDLFLTCALCGDPEFQGTCTSNGQCAIDMGGSGSGFNCPGCSSFCIDLCGIDVCADFLFQ